MALPFFVSRLQMSADMSDIVKMYSVHVVSKLDCLNARCWQDICIFSYCANHYRSLNQYMSLNQF
jgi:hypothetical protein